MVEQVERLAAQVHTEALAEVEIARDSNIHIRKAGRADNVAAGVSEADAAGGHKGGGIKPAVDVARVRRKVSVPEPVGMRGGIGGRGIGRDSYGERHSRLGGI